MRFHRVRFRPCIAILRREVTGQTSLRRATRVSRANTRQDNPRRFRPAKQQTGLLASLAPRPVIGYRQGHPARTP